MEKKGLNKLDYIDNLKVALTCLVVAHHAGQPYGGSGGFWVIKSEQTTNVGVFFEVTAAIFFDVVFHDFRIISHEGRQSYDTWIG